MLILLSREYTVAQASAVLEIPRSSMLRTANGAAACLGSGDWAAAVVEARRLGLLQ